MEGRVRELEALIQNAIIIPDHTRSRSKSDTVELGSIVKVQGVAARKSETYTIVGSTEADPTEGRISNESPVAKSLIGRRGGEAVDVETPVGVLRYSIVSVD